MATVFTVAPSNRSNTEVQNKRKEFPIVSKQEHFASMVFRHAQKKNQKKTPSWHIKINKMLEEDETCGGEITYARMRGRMRAVSPRSISSHVSGYT